MNTHKRPPLWLLTLLIMFPQLVETIYSPALPDIARAFQVSSERAAQTLSVYFVAFAIGVALDMISNIAILFSRCLQLIDINIRYIHFVFLRQKYHAAKDGHTEGRKYNPALTCHIHSLYYSY